MKTINSKEKSQNIKYKKANAIIIKTIISIASVLIVLFITLVCFSIFIRMLRNHFLPQEQPNSSWKSEDNTLCISIDDNYPYLGMIIIDGKMLELEVRGGTSEGGIICLYSTSLPEGKIDKQLYEVWDISVKGSKKFVATVKESGLSADRVGKKITFHRIEYLSDMQKIKEILGSF